MPSIKNIRDPFPPFGNYDEPPEEKPTFLERFRNACLAVVFGIVFFHVLFYGSKIFVRIAV